MKLPRQPKVYPNDINMLSFLFTIARNTDLLLQAITIIEFVRDHPNISEEQVRQQLRYLVSIPPERH